MGKWKLVNILEIPNGTVKWGGIWDSEVPVEQVSGTLGLATFKVIWCTWKYFLEIHVLSSKLSFWYTYDSFSAKLFMGVSCDSPYKSYFLEFRNLILKKN